MCVVLELVCDGWVYVCVSVGNIGVLMVLLWYLLKILFGIDCFVMVMVVLIEKGYCYLFDFGVNVDCSVEYFYQFVVMGVVVVEVLGCVLFWVVLFNVGIEEIKGNQQVKLVVSLLQKVQGLNFSGYIEGDGLYCGEVDVVVCDGFVGNILLKVSEGLVVMVLVWIEQCFCDGLVVKLVGVLVLLLLCWLCGDIVLVCYNGVSFFGLQGIVVKSYGFVVEEGFQSVLCCVVLEVWENLL